ncbi:hypothetical protein, partial [Methylacidiphilum sp. Yel]|uniref:hypothetical protein n=1 Tax=Methylacidiphilum sp. Yel TaxID=1847730 RepID=UPI001ABCB71A
IFLLDFNCSFLFIHNYTTHSYNLSPYIPMPEGRGITAMDGKLPKELPLFLDETSFLIFFFGLSPCFSFWKTSGCFSSYFASTLSHSHG